MSDQEMNNQDLIFDDFEMDQAQQEIISQRKICYYSNFDINVNEWFEEYENIQIFKDNVQKNLGKLWLQYLSQAIKLNSTDKSVMDIDQESYDSNDKSLKVLLECFLLEVPQVPSDIDNQINNNKPVTYDHQITSSLEGGSNKNDSQNLSSASQRFNMNLRFEEFYDISLYWFQGSNTLSTSYEIVDQQTFKSLLHTFYYVAMKEMTNITKKRESDERFAISQLTEKALAKHNSKKLPSHGSWSSNLTSASTVSQSTKISQSTSLQQKINKEGTSVQIQKQTSNITGDHQTSQKESKKWSPTKMRNLIPGFSIIKNKVISPLLVATERVVEYIIPSKNKNQNQDDISDKDSSENKSLPDQFNNLSLHDSENRRKLKRKRFQQLLRDDSIFDQEFTDSVDYQNLLAKASDCIDVISKRRKINESVTSHFVTNIIEIKNDALNQLKTEKEEEKQVDISTQIKSETDLNIRFIKPSKNFYNKLMGLWLRFDKTRLSSITFEEFMNYITKHSLIPSSQVEDQQNQEHSNSEQLIPTKQFFSTLKNEWLRMKQQQDEFSISQFFNQVKSNLFQKWNEQIINKSKKFQKVSSE
ncbi:UNKNOWN [Stylonychia lemnae]|uniref:EF-hand domain-containing protein n=1 Tax=Stylonychia lemnae TaxID=5949 RepID=A0A078A2Q7_STYLE|nr:UNKNOWN [Stylonychia lemnae]|eukprot:CDW76553.1 UNKNOWN [Stylonychia lemnae]